MSKINAYINEIQQRIDRIVEAVAGLDESFIRWKPSENEWSIMEILCHVEEATLYWLEEIGRLTSTPGTEWGRGLQHEGRLAAVASASEREVQEAIASVQKSKDAVQAALSALTDDMLAIEGPSRNPRFGTNTVQFIVDHLLVEHLEKHRNQIERNKAKK